MGYTVYGLYFEEDLVAKSWAHVITLINAIAEAETLEDMKSAIDAAREAYDALSEEDQKYINNYQELLDAEAEYLVLVANSHAEGAAAAAAEAAAIAEEAAAAAEEAATLAEVSEEAAAAATAAAAAAEEAETAAATAAAAAVKAASAAEAGDIKAAAAAEAEALAALEAAREALAKAQAALEAARAADNSAAMAAAREAAEKELEELAGTDTGDYSDHQLKDYEQALEEAAEAVENAKTPEEIEQIMAELRETLDAIAASCPSRNFSDLALGQWYHEYTDFVLIHGLMNGMGETKFAPGGNLTRAMMVTTLYRLAGEPEVESTSKFVDVADNEWYSDAVAWAAENGIVNGMTETTFEPMRNITREQAATILYRYTTKYLGIEPGKGATLTYPDADLVSDYAKDAVAWATAEEIFIGFPDGSFQPKGTLTRAQMAKLLTVLSETN